MEMSDESKSIKRKYFVAYDYWNADDIHGMANGVVETKLPISDKEDLLSITDHILFCNPDIKKVVISNWRKFEDPE